MGTSILWGGTPRIEALFRQPVQNKIIHSEISGEFGIGNVPRANAKVLSPSESPTEYHLPEVFQRRLEKTDKPLASDIRRIG